LIYKQTNKSILATTLERYVESEYTLVYLHYGLQSSRQPSYKWLVNVYKMLDRKYKKNLKALFIVHPTFLIKILWKLFKPLISTKFYKKVTYCATLNELDNYMDLNNLTIPQTVKDYDSKMSYSKNNNNNNNNSSGTGGSGSGGGNISSTISAMSTSSSNVNNPLTSSDEASFGPYQQFRVSLDYIAKNNNGDCIPLVLKETDIFLRKSK
jgi:Rho GTPase-activating protein 8